MAVLRRSPPGWATVFPATAARFDLATSFSCAPRRQRCPEGLGTTLGRAPSRPGRSGTGGWARCPRPATTPATPCNRQSRQCLRVSALGCLPGSAATRSVGDKAVLRNHRGSLAGAAVESRSQNWDVSTSSGRSRRLLNSCGPGWLIQPGRSGRGRASALATCSGASSGGPWRTRPRASMRACGRRRCTSSRTCAPLTGCCRPQTNCEGSGRRLQRGHPARAVARGPRRSAAGRRRADDPRSKQPPSRSARADRRWRAQPFRRSTRSCTARPPYRRCCSGSTARPSLRIVRGALVKGSEGPEPDEADGLVLISPRNSPGRGRPTGRTSRGAAGTASPLRWLRP